ncbi:hypothetical protein DFH09DRAFT_1097753 [Mycena vulgaris]|nr:hypothetical protein DFH09DRAFT_1097753 [Mycena vulgaris]
MPPSLGCYFFWFDTSLPGVENWMGKPLEWNALHWGVHLKLTIILPVCRVTRWTHGAYAICIHFKFPLPGSHQWKWKVSNVSRRPSMSAGAPSVPFCRRSWLGESGGVRGVGSAGVSQCSPEERKHDETRPPSSPFLIDSFYSTFLIESVLIRSRPYYTFFFFFKAIPTPPCLERGSADSQPYRIDVGHTSRRLSTTPSRDMFSPRAGFGRLELAATRETGAHNPDPDRASILRVTMSQEVQFKSKHSSFTSEAILDSNKLTSRSDRYLSHTNDSWLTPARHIAGVGRELDSIGSDSSAGPSTHNARTEKSNQRVPTFIDRVLIHQVGHTSLACRACTLGPSTMPGVATRIIQVRKPPSQPAVQSLKPRSDSPVPRQEIPTYLPRPFQSRAQSVTMGSHADHPSSPGAHKGAEPSVYYIHIKPEKTLSVLCARTMGREWGGGIMHQDRREDRWMDNGDLNRGEK